jgi:hypothetical protein
MRLRAEDVVVGGAYGQPDTSRRWIVLARFTTPTVRLTTIECAPDEYVATINEFGAVETNKLKTFLRVANVKMDKKTFKFLKE